MAHKTDDRFQSIESAHEYMSLLGEVLNETQGAIQEDIARAPTGQRARRRVDALQLVDYKLERLRCHLGATRRLLNDLRILRRLLQREGRPAHQPLPLDRATAPEIVPASR